MDKIIFVDFQTKVCSAFLNSVSDTIWDALGEAKTPVEARNFIGAVEEAPNDGTAYVRQTGGWVDVVSSIQHNTLGGRSVADAHPTSAITGLDTALSGKAPLSHTHVGSEVSGIIAAQVAFSPSGNIVATNVQAAISELESDTAALLAGKQDNLPSQTGQAGQFLTTNGSVLDWAVVDALPDQTGHAGEFLTTDGADPSWVPVQSNSTPLGLFEHAATIVANYAIGAGNNAISGGPVTVADGVSVTVPSGSVWSIV